MYRRSQAAALVLLLALGAPALAAIIDITVSGTVSYNSIGTPPLNGFTAGAPVSLTFQVDSSNYVNSGTYATRGYPIDTSSFVLSSGAASVGLQNPFPSGETPYFTIRNNDPGVDGFILATSYEFPTGVPLNQTHTNGQRYFHNYYVTYGPDKLSSLDILDALGTYDYAGLTVFNWTIWRISPDFVFAEFDFGQMTITPEPTALSVLLLLGVLGIRRR